jgi:hypothetical protein
MISRKRLVTPAQDAPQEELAQGLAEVRQASTGLPSMWIPRRDEDGRPLAPSRLVRPEVACGLCHSTGSLSQTVHGTWLCSTCRPDSLIEDVIE